MKNTKRPDYWHENDTLAYRKGDLVIHHRGTVSGSSFVPFLPESVAYNGIRQSWRKENRK